MNSLGNGGVKSKKFYLCRVEVTTCFVAFSLRLLVKRALLPVVILNFSQFINKEYFLKAANKQSVVVFLKNLKNSFIYFHLRQILHTYTPISGAKNKSAPIQ